MTIYWKGRELITVEGHLRVIAQLVEVLGG